MVVTCHTAVFALVTHFCCQTWARGSVSRADFTSTVLGLADGAKELGYACESSQKNRFTVNSQY